MGVSNHSVFVKTMRIGRDADRDLSVLTPVFLGFTMLYVQKLFVDFFQHAHPIVQLIILLVVLGLFVLLVYLWVRERFKYDAMKNQMEGWQNKHGEQVLENGKLVGQINELSGQVENSQANLEILNETKGRLEQKLQHEGEKLAELEKDRDHYKTEWHTLKTQIDKLQDIDSTVWYAPERFHPTIPIPEFVPLSHRPTRFVVFLNLKGGVGKTTLVANLASAFATGILGNLLRVLVVDLDFQGTLSNRCVTEPLLKERRRRQESKNRFSRNTSHRLIDPEFLQRGPQDLFNQLTVPISETNDFGSAIVANEVLENADFRQQAQFVVQDLEVRFHHRGLFHTQHVFQSYDFVFFDCPPRVTTSAINALTCCDFVVLPTSLHPEDTEAVPRTLEWLDKLRRGHENQEGDYEGGIPTFQARTAAVILNRTYRGGTIDDVTKDESRSLIGLQFQVQKHVGDCVLHNIIRHHPEVAQYAAGSVPFGTTENGHELYQAVATELYERIRN